MIYVENLASGVFYMDKIKLLQARKRQLLDAGKVIREEINNLTDKDSFVELSAFSFSESEFYGEKAEGEGVVTGFATINDYPYYIVAQNSQVLSGGISNANCKKIYKCLEQAEKNGTPVIYLLSSLGVRVGEGVNVLEGIAALLSKAAQLKGVVPQYLVVNGEVYGQISLLAGICDFNFFIEKKSVLATSSPLVITASAGENLPKEKIGGALAIAKSQLATLVVKDLGEVKAKITSLSELLSVGVVDCDDLNRSVTSLKTAVTATNLLSVFDKDSVIELGASYCSEVKCVLARIGGISVAAVIFDNENGVELCAGKARKLKEFARLASNYALPYITFVNTLGIKATPDAANSPVIKELADYISILNTLDTAKISVVTGKAVGLGYTIFAAKSMGYDFSYAFANAKIALFDSVQGAEVELTKDAETDMSKLAAKYADENSDPINAAKGGYIDNIIEPAFVRQYIIASLQMLVK